VYAQIATGGEMAEQTALHQVPKTIAKNAHIDRAGYEALYRASVENPERFWAEQAERFIDWFRPWDRVADWDFREPRIRWFEGAELNVSHNCIDRHLDKRGDKTAILWEGDEPGDTRELSYRELHEAVCRLANGLRSRGVRRGDRVCIYMPMVPEAAVAMLACTRIGAIHSVVFGGFSPNALRDRIQDADCKLVITADEGVRGGKKVPLKANTDKALEECPGVETVVVYERTGADVNWVADRDIAYAELVDKMDADCEPESMSAEDPMFILYTSGSTGKPKGVLHTTGGYILYAAMTHHYVFDYHEDDIYWCTADVGWVTGHS
jgi:acetyl-CoA synthetase